MVNRTYVSRETVSRVAAGMFEGSLDAERQRILDEWIARNEER